MEITQMSDKESRIIELIDIKSSKFKRKKGYVEFPSGKRNHLHPDLKAIDGIDCKFLYDPSTKVVFVEYKPETTNGVKNYTKQILRPAKTTDDLAEISKELIDNSKENV